MIYLLLCTIIFLSLALYRREWLILAMMTYCNYLLTVVYSSADPMLYKLVPVVTCIGALRLCWYRTTLGFYHAIILLLTLIAYAALAFDVSQGRHILIYNNYEAVIYGLVACQFVAVLPAIRATYHYFTAGRRTGLENIRWDPRS